MPLFGAPVRTLLRARAMPIAGGVLLLMLAGTAHAGPLFEAPFQAFPLNGPVGFIASADLNDDGFIDGRADYTNFWLFNVEVKSEVASPPAR